MALELHSLTVAAVSEETADSRAFTFDVPAPLRAAYRGRAGQFLTLEIPWPGGGFAIRRCYSLSSCPELDEAPRITVKRVEGGRMSGWLIDHVKVGDILRVAPPDGRFLLDATAGSRPLTLLGGGSGITPLLALLKSALARTRRDVRLIYANRDAASIIHRRELDALERAHPGRLRVHHHLDLESGLLGADDVASLVRGHEDGDHYVCGPEAFMDTVATGLGAAGVSPERIYFERFVSGVDPDRRAAIAAARAAAAAPASFQLRLAAQAFTIAYGGGQTLLAAAQRAAVKAPSSCEDGYCGTCTARLVRGQVDLRSSKALGPRELAQGKILLCQATPANAGPLEVDCDGARVAGAAHAHPPQPLLPRVLASVFVALVMTLFFLYRSHP